MQCSVLSLKYTTIYCMEQRYKLQCISHHHIALHYHFTALHSITFLCTEINSIALHCTPLHFTALHRTALHETALHRTALHCGVFHPTLLTALASYGQNQHQHLDITTASSRLKLGSEKWVECRNIVVNDSYHGDITAKIGRQLC